ncbi:MAG: hypothetical protein QM791_17410 [Ferruginibacter sp.]
MRILVSFFAIITFVNIGFSQVNQAFCEAAAKGNFNKVERLFKREIKKRSNGTSYDNGPGSGMQITHQYNLDTLIMWLKSQPCVEDAYWDKCETKISIYPGWVVIGAKFKTEQGITEKCFHLQQGTTGNINIFGWKAHLFKRQHKLVYKKMYTCDGFIEKQRSICNSQKR